MLELLDRIFGYLKTLPFWGRIQGLASLITLFAAVQVFGYQYVRWRYGLSPGLPLYLNSYVFRQLLLATLTLAVLALIFSYRRRPPEATESLGVARRVTRLLRVTPRRILTIVVLALAIPTFLALSPRHVSHIRIRFLDEPAFDRDAFTYLIYELNREQRSWHFEINPDPFNPNALSADEAARCADDPLCLAQLIAEGQPLIAITSRPLGSDSFWKNGGRVSVITTFGGEAWAPLTPYEYLAHMVVEQSIVIHLAFASGLPSSAFRESRSAFGSLFSFTPRRSMMKAEILASQLTPVGEMVLMNTFGLDYMRTCSSLLGLGWLEGPRVRTNLERCFGVKLVGAGNSPD